MTMNHRFLVLGLAGLLVWAGLSQAYDFQYNKMGVWLLGGGTQLRKGFITNSDDPNGNLSTTGPTVKFGYHYRPIPLLGFGFDLNGGVVKNKTYPLPPAPDSDFAYRCGFGNGDLFLSLNFQQFIPSRKVNPYITLGGGATAWRSTRVKKGQESYTGNNDYILREVINNNKDTVAQQTIAPSLSAGLGVEVFLIRAIALNLNVTYHEIFFDKDKYVMLPGQSVQTNTYEFTSTYDSLRDMRGGGAFDFSAGLSFYGVSSTKPKPPTGSIAGVVKDKEGKPVEGASVDFARAEIAPQTTGPDGKYAVSGVALGPIGVKVTKDKYLPGAGSGMILKNKIAPVDVTLEKKPVPKATLAGKIADQDGKPIVMAKVTVGDATVATDATGFYKAEVTVPDTGEIAIVNATADGYKPKQATVALKPGTPEAKDFTLVSATLKIRLVVLFRTGKAEIDDYGDIDKAAKLLKDNPEIKVEIAGYTDSRGSKKKNYRLSQARADAVMQAMVYRGGIDPTRIVSKGYGPENPVAPNTTKAGRALNRRIELRVL
jgi:outer membrane protein OmpA-like peptidoglycan-associated protein